MVVVKTLEQTTQAVPQCSMLVELLNTHEQTACCLFLAPRATQCNHTLTVDILSGLIRVSCLWSGQDPR